MNNATRQNTFWLKWMLNYSFGELLAIGVATTVGRLALVEASDFISEAPVYFTPLMLALVGIAEGLTIGYLQWRSLTKLIIDFKPGTWVAATVATTTIGWLLIMPPTIFLIALFIDFDVADKYYSIIYALVAGATFGGLIGVVQFFILKKFLTNAFVWVISNMLGWMFSFLLISLSVSLLGSGRSFLFNASVLVAGCVLSGLLQGLVTGTSLHFLMSVRGEHQAIQPSRP